MSYQYNTILLKVVLLGKTNVGKTSILHQLVYNNFNNYPDSTIGAAFISKEYEFLYSEDDYLLYQLSSDPKGKKRIKVKLAIWDTAGQERYNSLVPMYYRDAHLIFIVNEATEELITTPTDLIKGLITNLNPDIFEISHKTALTYMIFNKCDLLEYDIYNRHIVVPNKHNIRIKYVSAAKNINISNMFMDAVLEYVNKHLSNMINAETLENSFSSDNFINRPNTSTCC